MNDQSKETELKPCPFHGKPPFISPHNTTMAGVLVTRGCPQCHEWMSMDEWNTRSPDTAQLLKDRESIKALLAHPDADDALSQIGSLLSRLSPQEDKTDEPA